MKRSALTLIEVVVVVAILALLMGLSLGAISNVRHAALLTSSKNQLRQLGLAQANYTSNRDKLPPLEQDNVYTKFGGGRLGRPTFLFHELLPYLEHQGLYEVITTHVDPESRGLGSIKGVPVKCFLNPLDRSAGNVPVYYGAPGEFISITSYAGNAMVFRDYGVNPSEVTDGLSHTIFFSEHYGWRCGSAEFHFTHMLGTRRPDGTIDPRSGMAIKMTRPTFADADAGDWVPVGGTATPDSIPRDGITFQATPRVEECDPRQLNASSPRGLQVLMGDISVRVIPPSVASVVFWAGVTPVGGEFHSFD